MTISRAAMDALTTRIVRDACETDPEDVDNPDCIFISMDTLHSVVLDALRDSCTVVEPPAASAEAQTDIDGPLPCPFCGSQNISDGEAITETSNGKRFAQSTCLNCAAFGPASEQLNGPDYGGKKAIAAWNRRVSSTPALREVTTEDAREASNVRRAVIYSLPCIEGGYKDHDELELAAMIVALESFRARLSTAQGMPGWKLVPTTATPDMVGAGSKAARHSDIDGYRLLAIYRAMIAAAPEAP